jgi:acyl dehydratase
MDTVQLESPPSLTTLYAHAVLGAIVPGGGDDLPARRLVVDDVEVSPEHVAAYSRVCGFGMRSTVPATYPHVLAFPIHMKLMTDRSFPFSVLGLVHVANRIDMLAPIEIGSRLGLGVWTENLRPHKRGKQFDIVSEAEIDGTTVWRGRSNYLRKGDGSDSDAPAEEPSVPEELGGTADWDVPGDTGRRYAEVSGDRNPIHMHPLSARLFGFPSAIAHGMWTKARCLASFEGRLPDAYTVEAAFKAPLRIPGKARLRSGAVGDGWAFRLESRDGEHTHVIGSVAPST